MKLKTPEVPNFILIEMPVGKRQDGFKLLDDKFS